LSLKKLRPLLLFGLLLVLASCGGGDDGNDDGAGAPASVSISSPLHGATVTSPVRVTMEAAGFTVEPAGDVSDGAGHFHLIVDDACLPTGEQIPADETHIHLADGASETELDLEAGEHTLCLQAGDGQHAALGLTDEITITVDGADGTTTEAEEAEEPIEDWQGTYHGEVVWDCGSAGTRRGSVEANVLILTYEDGLATMDAEHTVTESCVDTGSLTTPIYVEGERTASGFTFPSELWGIPGSFDLDVTGDTADGRLSGSIPGPGAMTIDFDLLCTLGC
jgi:Domain of unknown function (DUF4399)